MALRTKRDGVELAPRAVPLRLDLVRRADGEARRLALLVVLVEPGFGRGRRGGGGRLRQLGRAPRPAHHDLKITVHIN